MKKSIKLNFIGVCVLLTGVWAQAESSIVRCHSQLKKISIDLSDLKNPTFDTGAGQSTSTVISRDEIKLVLTAADLETFEMTTIEFKILDLENNRKNKVRILGVLSLAEGPGSTFRSEELICLTTSKDRHNLLSLQSNSHW